MDTETVHGGESRAALEAALDAAALMNPVHAGTDGREYLIVSQHHRHYDITDPLRLPSRIAQSVTLDDRAGLIAYANRFKLANSILLADVDAGRISALIDYHCETQQLENDGKATGLQEGSPRHNQHRAHLQLRHSEAFEVWSAFEGKLHVQSEFAFFLDENAVDVVDPDGSKLLEIVKDLQVAQDVQFTGKVDIHSGDVALRFENESRQLQKIELPKQVWLNIPIWEGEEPVRIECRLRWRHKDGVCTLGLDMKRIEHIKRELFSKITDEIAQATGLPGMAGRI